MSSRVNVEPQKKEAESLTKGKGITFGSGKVKAPCLGCADRVPNECRATCERWKKYIEEREADKAKLIAYQNENRNLYRPGMVRRTQAWMRSQK